MKKASFIILFLILIGVTANRFDLFSTFDQPDITGLNAAIEKQYDGLAAVQSVSAESGERSGNYEDKYQKLAYTARIEFSDHVVATENMDHLIRLSDFFDRYYRQCRYWVIADLPSEKVDPITQEISVNLLDQCKQCLGIFDYYNTPFFKGSVYQVDGVAVFEKYLNGDWQILRFTINNPECLTQAEPPDWLDATYYQRR